MIFDRLTRDWAGRSVLLLAGGPSLRGFDFEQLRGKGIVVAINDAIFAAPFADCAFTIDMVWLRNRAEALASFSGEKVAAVPADYADPQPGLRYFLRVCQAGKSVDPITIYTGENSGFAALDMAISRGASRIALLGYDLTGPGHFHRGYAWGSRFGANCYRQWAQYFTALAGPAAARGVQVINCNHRSAIRCFPFGRWEDVAE